MAAARPSDAARPDAPAGGWVGPLCVLIVGSFMSVLDTSIVNIAIPRMQVDLSAATDDIEWVVTAYTLALGVVVPVTGWLGLRLGLTRLYVLAMVGFAAGSALCGLAWDLPSMIAFRVLQAMPGGVLPVVALTMLYRIVPAEKIGSAMGLYGLSIVVAPAIGPTIGGALVQYADWRLVFFINVPVGVVGTALAVIVFPRIHPTNWPRFDLWGFVSIAYGLFALLLAFAEGEDWGWTGYRVLGLFVSAALALALFVVIELEVEHPLLDLRIFATPAYTVSLLLLGVGVTGLFSALYFLPQYLQRIQGLEEMDSGLVLLPASCILVVFMPLTGRLYDRLGPRYLIAVGLLIMAYGSHLLAQMTPDTPRLVIQEWLAVRNLGVGLSMMPIITTGVSSLPATLTAAGSAMNNVMQRVASSVAIAVLGGLNTSKGAQLMIDRAALVPLDGQALPAVARAESQGPAALVAPWTELSRIVTTQTYANGFQIVAVLSVAGALLGLTTRSGRAPARKAS
jgi:EmrB/QacA subfamily drug resistance transporter